MEQNFTAHNPKPTSTQTGHEIERASPQKTRVRDDVVTHPSGCSRVIRWPTLNKYGRGSINSSVRSVCCAKEVLRSVSCFVCSDCLKAENGAVEGLRDADGDGVAVRACGGSFDGERIER